MYLKPSERFEAITDLLFLCVGFVVVCSICRVYCMNSFFAVSQTPTLSELGF